jgi:hypothetical protein
MSDITMDTRFDWFIGTFNKTVEELRTRANDLVRDNDFLNKRVEELQKQNEEKDQKLSEQEEEIEKLKNIISNMEDGEGVVDFVNDFIKKDEDLIRIQLQQLADTQKRVDESVKKSAMDACAFSGQCKTTIDHELAGMTLPKIREHNDTAFKSIFMIRDVVRSLNAWRENICERTGSDFIQIGQVKIYKQNDDGTVRFVERGVKVYMSRPVTEKDVEDDPSLYFPAFLNITGANITDYTIQCRSCSIFRDWAEVLQSWTSVVVQEDFEPTRDEGSGDLLMNLEDIWYIRGDVTVTFRKNYRNCEKFIHLDIENKDGIIQLKYRRDF